MVERLLSKNLGFQSPKSFSIFTKIIMGLMAVMTPISILFLIFFPLIVGFSMFYYGNFCDLAFVMMNGGFIPVILYIAASIILFVFSALENSNIPESEHKIWAIAILVGAPISMLIYWYLYIWKEPETKPTQSIQSNP